MLGICESVSAKRYITDACGRCLATDDMRWNVCFNTTAEISMEKNEDMVMVNKRVIIWGIVIAVLLIICCVLIGIYVHFQRLKYNEYKLQEKMIVNNELEVEQPGQEVDIDEGERVEGETVYL